MRKFLFVLLGLVVVLIGAALVVPFVVPTDTYKQQIAAQVESATGRKLTIDGPLRFTILPHLGLDERIDSLGGLFDLRILRHQPLLEQIGRGGIVA